MRSFSSEKPQFVPAGIIYNMPNPRFSSISEVKYCYHIPKVDCLHLQKMQAI